jgi:hypothetical protein
MWGCYDRFLLGTINLLGQTDWLDKRISGVVPRQCRSTTIICSGGTYPHEAHQRPSELATSGGCKFRGYY